MESQFHQLRFDISEKVRIQPQQPGIGTLIELDLFPDVEMKEEEEHVKIQGYLRLNGMYQPQMEESAEQHAFFSDGNQEIAYVIPVEITLPADRAELERISAEIESFDYNVISPFELQIEAVLTIDGLIPETKKNVEEGVNLTPAFEAEPMLAAYDDREIPGYSYNTDQESPMNDVGFKNRSDQEYTAPPQDYYELRVEEENIREQPSFAEEVLSREKDYQFAVPANNPPDSQYLNHDAEDSQATSIMDGSALDSEQSVKTHKGPLSSTEWSRWLITDEQEKFTSVKMVIVQEEETIDEIANRYDVMVSQLSQLNSMSDANLSPGKVLHVPEKAKLSTDAYHRREG